MVNIDIRKANRSLINLFKTKCLICGEESKCCLEVHHIDEKSFNLSLAVTSKDTDIIKKELNKCICVCANCHKKIHAKEILLDDNM